VHEPAPGLFSFKCLENWKELYIFAAYEKNVSGKVREKNITFTPIIGDPKVRYRDEALVILGKFCYNLAALVFGGVILSQVLDYKRENLDVILIGLAVMLFLIVLGWRLIKIGLCKIK